MKAHRGILTDHEKLIWDRVNKLTEVEGINKESLLIYCREMAIYEQCQTNLNGKFTQRAPGSDYEQQRPEVSIGQAALKVVMTIGHRLGFDDANKKAKPETSNGSDVSLRG